jgi:transposase
MNDPETIARFIFLRSQGWSFNRIQVELNVSKPTLIKWSRQHQFAIANLRATETEALAEQVFRQRHERWDVLARQLKRLEEEIEKRDLEEIPASRLHGIATALRAEINREIGRVHFSETTSHIPMEEFVIDRHEWEV